MRQTWYDKTVGQIEKGLSTDAANGLRREEVSRRLKEEGGNRIYALPRASFGKYIRHILTDYTTILMLITLLIAGVFHDLRSSLAMGVILFTYYAVIIVTYVKSQRVLEGVGNSSLPGAKVQREGKLCRIRQEGLVRGDVIYLSTGDIVPCDARLVECSGLEVMEAALTGVSRAVRKDASYVSFRQVEPAEQRNMVFASTIVTGGSARAICCETGADTLVAVMGKNIPTVSHERLRIFDNINKFCRRWTLFMTVSIVILIGLDLALLRIPDRGIFDSFMNGIAMSVASMSEFYVAFAYIALACGIYTAAAHKKGEHGGVLIRNTGKLETVKNLTCLVLSKEAAFQLPERSVGRVYANGEALSPTDHGYRRNSVRVLRYALISTGLYGAENLTRRNQSRDNRYSIEEEAIIAAAESVGEYNIGLEEKYPLLEHIGKGPFTDFDTSLVGYEGGYFAVLRGEHTRILANCRYYSEEGRVYEMTEAKRYEFIMTAEQIAREAFHVIAIASKDTVYDNLDRLAACQTDMTFEGFVAVSEPTLPGTARNLVRCAEAGMRIIMLCGTESEDNAILAEGIGLISSREEILSGKDMAGMSPGLFRTNIRKYKVYEGLSLTQKRTVIRQLRESGEKVGCLCSGLSDIILSRDADVSFSVSAVLSEDPEENGASGRELYGAGNAFDSGCDALKFVSDVIVSEPEPAGTGGFNAILDSVICCKSVYYNMHRMIRYLLSSQLARLLLLFVSVFFGVVSLDAVQILFCGLIIDFAALMTITFERTGYPLLKMPARLGGKFANPFLSNPDSVLCGMLWAGITLASSLLMSRLGVISSGQITVCCFVSYLLTQIAVLNECKREQSIFSRGIRFNGAHVLTLLFTVLFLVLAFLVPAFGSAFSVAAVPYPAVIGILIPPVCVILYWELKKLLYPDRERRKKQKYARETVPGGEESTDSGEGSVAEGNLTAE